MSFIVSGLCPFPVVGVPTQASSVVGLGKPTLRIPRAPTRRGSSPQCIRQALGTATGRTPATSAPGLSLTPPHLHRDWAQPRHVCTGTGLTTRRSAVEP